jgi:hypothetical protein
MGKPIKIEISDLMPCNEDDEFLLPRCDSIEELWPAILTKALIKLNSYKFNYKEYQSEEIGDIGTFCQLTGYVGLYMNSNIITQEALNSYLSDDAYEGKKCFVFCINKDTRKERKLKTIKEVAETTMTTVFKRALTKNNSRTIVSNKNFDTAAFKSVSAKGVLNLQLLNRRSSLAPDEAKILEREKSVERKSRKIGTTGHLPHINEFTAEIERVANSSSSSKFKISPSMSQKKLNQISSNFLGTLANYINENKIIANLAYAIPDFFDNSNFNMKRLKPLDFSDLKNSLKTAQDRYKSIFKTLTKEQRKIEINKYNDLRKEQKLEKSKRIEELKEKGKKFSLVKIKNDVIGSTHLNFLVPYTDEEIFMGKKCILNNWEFPPPNFFDSQEKEKLFNFKPTTDSQSSPTKDRLATTHNFAPLTPMASSDKHIVLPDKEDPDMTLDLKDKGKSTWNKETYLQQLIVNNLDQYYLQRDPIIRLDQGTWIDLNEIKGMFNHFAVLNNPRYFKQTLLCDNNWQYYNNDILELKEEYEVFALNQISTEVNEGNISQDSSRATLLINFQPNTEVNPRDMFSYNLNFYVTFDLMNAAGVMIKEGITLNKFFHSHIMIDLDKNDTYYLLVRGHFAPFGFYFQIFSDFHVLENMSLNNYLRRTKNYQIANFKLDHLPLERNKFYLLSKFAIAISEVTNVRFTLRYPDKYGKQFVELFLNTNGHNKKRITFNEVITLHPLDMFENYYVSMLSLTPLAHS